MAKMKALFSIAILTFCLLQSHAAQGEESRSWTDKLAKTWDLIKWPHDRTYDEVNLLPFGQELKLNYFLQHLQNELGLQVYFKFVPSLQGQNIEEQALKSLSAYQDDDTQGDYLLFFLSLSDRQFLILPSFSLKGGLDPDQLNSWVQLMVPSLSRQNYTKAMEDFLHAVLFKYAPSSPLKVPQLNLKKSYNLNSLLFFAVGFLIIFMLGHKLRKAPKVIEKDPGLIKKKTSPITVFW